MEFRSGKKGKVGGGLTSSTGISFEFFLPKLGSLTAIADFFEATLITTESAAEAIEPANKGCIIDDPLGPPTFFFGLR